MKLNHIPSSTCRLIRLGAALTALACLAQLRGEEDSRVVWGRERLEQALLAAGYPPGAVPIKTSIDAASSWLPAEARKPEGFAVRATANHIEVVGTDAAGVLYGCLEAAERVARHGEAPADWQDSGAPQMALRGTCALLMKLGGYNYPVSPEEFPFFYDRVQWTAWLDFMAEQRFNTFTLWNGHPFAYFVKFDRFTEAQAGMDPALLERNRQLLHWLVDEAGRRNIRLLFEFYNIHYSVGFRKAHDLPPEMAEPTPLVRDYTAYAVERFVREFPEIGYYITPGEALGVTQTESWLNGVLLPAMQRGGVEGPVCVRAWGKGINLPIAQALATAHPELWMERKFNIEMLATPQEDPRNRPWAELTGRHIVNLHEAANLAPFRWFPPEYIRRSVVSAIETGANGLHLYPRRAWRWPYGAEPDRPLFQWERDRYWYLAWARYAWNPARDPKVEHEWWLKEFTRRFGDATAARGLLESQEAGADVLPGLQRLIWLGDSNHSAVSAGIRLAQFDQQATGIQFLPLSDVAQRIPEYLATLRAGEVPKSPTPPEFLGQLAQAAESAANAARDGAAHARQHRDEAAAWAEDARAIALVAGFYREKMAAAELQARAAAPGSAVRPEAFVVPLARSVEIFRQLTAETRRYDSISDVNLEATVRLIKVPYHWADLLPVFEAELALYRERTKILAPTQISTAPDQPGLVGMIFGDANLANPRGTHDLPFPGLAWRIGELDLPAEWSAEWRGTIIWPRDGEVPLLVRASHPAGLRLGDKTILARDNPPGESRVIFSARQGELVSVSLTFRHPASDTAQVELLWNPAGRGFVPIPPEACKHSDRDQFWRCAEIVRDGVINGLPAKPIKLR